MVLELGLLYKDLLDFVRLPDRNRGIRLLKLSMLVFKGHNNHSKYALEILRLLVHQLCSLSNKEAHEEFYGLFVNTLGKVDSHVAADERMEWLVHVLKKHMNHMYSDKTHKNITGRSKALVGVQDIACNFDVRTTVVTRARSHKVTSTVADEMAMLNDLRQLRPFQFVSGRRHNSFPGIRSSVMQELDVEHFRNWAESRHYILATERGN